MSLPLVCYNLCKVNITMSSWMQQYNIRWLKCNMMLAVSPPWDMHIWHAIYYVSPHLYAGLLATIKFQSEFLPQTNRQTNRQTGQMQSDACEPTVQVAQLGLKMMGGTIWVDLCHENLSKWEKSIHLERLTFPTKKHLILSHPIQSLPTIWHYPQFICSSQSTQGKWILFS